MKFLDEAKIYAKSGDGGKGAVAFRREKFIEHGGPWGGDGGRGADVVFRAVQGLNTLIDFRFTQHFKAQAGRAGASKLKTGASGEDLVIQVPVGTQILAEDKETLLADLIEEGQEWHALAGGKGGHGNAHYKTSIVQAPTKSTPGFPGQESWFWLRLKLLADAGIIGLPNAGKSTFLAAVSAAKPKIADYPFTTLHPELGVVRLGSDSSFVLADIPGLIAGAAQGHGLGIRFLGHIERTAILLHLIDATQDDVVAAYQTVRAELAEYGHELINKSELVALNKCDALDAQEATHKAKQLSKAIGKPVAQIAAATQQGVEETLQALYAEITAQRRREQSDVPIKSDWQPNLK